MLEGTYAFEKRWSNLRERYPTTPAQDAMIVRAINQLSSNHAAVNDLAETLPENLRALFRELAQAYLKAQRDAAHRVQEQDQEQAQEPVASETLVIDQPSRLRAVPNTPQHDGSNNTPHPLAEAATFIVEQPTSLTANPKSIEPSIEQPTLQHPDDNLSSAEKTKSPIKSAYHVTNNSLEQQLQSLAEKRKYANQSNRSKSKSSVGKNYKQSDVQRADVIFPKREDMAQILPSDRPQVAKPNIKPGIFQRLVNWLFGHE